MDEWRHPSRSPESICSLGYHSQTQWLVQPQIALLYDKIVMNKPVYDMVLARGERKESTLDYLLAQLIKEYKHQDILVVQDYELDISPSERQSVDDLLSYFADALPDRFRQLAIELHKSHRDRLRSKLAYLRIDEPMYFEIRKEIRLRERRIEALARGSIPAESQEGVRHCLEHVLLTMRLGDRIPIFEWEGYRKLRSWLLSIPSFLNTEEEAERLHLLDPTTEPLVLTTYFELLLGAVDVTDDRQLGELLRRRKHFKGARQEILKMNREIWQFLDSLGASEAGSILIEEFGEVLRERVTALQREYSKLTLEEDLKRRRPLVRLTTSMTSAAIALGSIFLPALGVLQAVSGGLGERLQQWWSRTTSETRYPHLAWSYTFQDYKRIYDSSLLRRRKAIVQVAKVKRLKEPELRANELSRNLGVKEKVLYDWEAQGLLSPVRSWQGWRVYTPDHVRRCYELMKIAPPAEYQHLHAFYSLAEQIHASSLKPRRRTSTRFVAWRRISSDDILLP